MSLELTGKLIEKLPLQSGVSKTGNSWQKQEFIIETDGQYPKKICTNLWGNNIDMLNSFKIGDMITISFDLESREFNGRWYTDVKTWRISAPQLSTQQISTPPPVQPPVNNQVVTAAQSGMRTTTEIGPTSPEPEYYAAEEGTTDDLPF